MNTSNVTEAGYIQNATPKTIGPVLYAVSCTLILVSFMIISMDFVAVFILRKCKRILLCSRMLSMNFVLSDAAGSFIFAVHQIIISVLDDQNDVILNSRVLSVGAIFTVSCASVAAMSLERVIALKLNLKYNLNSSKLKVYLIVSLIWIVNIVVVVAAIALGFYYNCFSNYTICDIWEASKAGRFVMVCLLIFYESVLAVSYVIIHGIASRHAKNMIASNMVSNGQTRNNSESLTSRQYAVTIAIAKIVLAFMLLHAPLVIHLIIFETYTDIRYERFRYIFHGISYLCMQINSFVSVRLYVAKFDECKLYFYLILSRISKKYETEAEKLRVKVYDIVVCTKMRKTDDGFEHSSPYPKINDLSTVRDEIFS